MTVFALKICEYCKNTNISVLGKVAARKFVIQFFWRNTAHTMKHSEMVITLKERHMSPYSFGRVLVSSGTTYGQNIRSEGLNHFERFLHKSLWNMVRKDSTILLSQYYSKRQYETMTKY